MKRQGRIYLDHAAGTPVSKAARKAMEPYFAAQFGNPSSLHSFGQEASRALDLSREKMAGLIGAGFREIIFTGSATEANNLALRGAVQEQRTKNKEQRTLKIIVSAIEHESVLETARDLEREGIEVVYLPADKEGRVDLKKLEDSLDENTILVSVMYGNNVVGTIQPIAEIANIIRNFRISNPIFHVDAVQAFQYLDCNIKTLGVDPVRGRASAKGGSLKDRGAATSNGVDMLTISSHKIYGPKGVGILVASGQWLKPIITGGGQEFGIRSGTENIPAIVGFAKAAEEAVKIREKEAKRLEKLRELLWREIKKAVPSAVRNTPEKNALPHILNVAFPSASKNLVARLDALGLAVSSGAACSTRSQEASYILFAMGIPEDLARRSIRFSLGRETTEGEIRKVGQAVKVALS